MSGVFDIIFFAAFAAFIGYRLYTTLGRKDIDDEIQKPAKDDNVVSMYSKAAEKAIDVDFQEITDDYDAIKATHGSDVAEKVKQIRNYDPYFTIDSFLNGAKAAFEMILNAFSKGDEETLKPLLSKDIYKSFAAEMKKRKASEKQEETTIVSVAASKIKEITLDKKVARIAVEIDSEQISVIKDKKGKIVEGNPSQVDEISEIWTFAKNLTSPNPNWELVATQSAG